MNERAIDIYDYDGTLCDSQEYINRLSLAVLEKTIEDHRGSRLSEDERQSLEFLSLAKYTGFFWDVKAPEILKEFGIDHDQFNDDYKSRLNTVRKNVRNQFYGKDNANLPLDEQQQETARQIQQKLEDYFVDAYGAPPVYKLFHDISTALENPDTIKAIATQRGHNAMAKDLGRFPEIETIIQDHFTGIGYEDPQRGKLNKPKPDPELILMQYERLIEEYDEQGLDISNLPLRMTGDTVLDVISMRNAQKVINQDRDVDQKIKCCVIGVVRPGIYADYIAQTLEHAAQDPDDPSGQSDIEIHIVENFQQHRELTDRLDTPPMEASADFDF